MIDRDDLTGRRESRRAAELKTLRAELVKRLDRLDFRFESLDPALAEMARHAERTPPAADDMSDEPAAPRKPPVVVTVRRHETVEITVTISAGLLDRVDEVARRKEISRDALLRLLIGDGLAKWEGA